jgi:hypothetical protein
MNIDANKNNVEKKCCGSVPCCVRSTQANENTKEVIKVSTFLSRADKWDHIKARWGINRMGYKVDPGIYAVGNPDADSSVLVTANYKLSFDALRKELTSLDAWILVLDTKGINVWCAAGKGTFGTDELVNRIELSGLKEVVNHRKLILPQLGAPGVSAHDVKKRSGFSVIYGPVRAADIPTFLEKGKKATSEMRRVHFDLMDRARVVPIEMVQGFRSLLLIMAGFFLLSGLSGSGYSFGTALGAGIRSIILLFSAYIAGAAVGPLLLPWLPGRSFSLKGFEAGVLFFALSFFTILKGVSLLEVIAWLLIMTAFSSFLTMNFTGASTYTSLSGVKREMRLAVPIQSTAAAAGIIMWLTGRFI